MWISVAALLGALGVVLGAFGAHSLEARLDAEKLEIWSTAVQYHLLHAAVLFALAAWGNAVGRSIQPSAALLVAGIVGFSGSLYLLALGGPSWLGPITPLGGLCFIGGWIALVWLPRSGLE